MRILIVGNGGREHALLWKLRRDAPSAEFYVTRPNAGMRHQATPVEIAPTDLEALSGWAAARRIDLAVVGPEAPLAAGLADRMQQKGVPVFGPSAGAARIEASKSFAKDLMRGAGVPTAEYRVFTDREAACAHVRERGAPIVVKASGLAAGKGVVVCETEDQAIDAIGRMMHDLAFGESGREVVIEALLEGEELSLFGIADGTDVALLPPSQDHKRIGEGDVGPNTGGMGAYAPVSVASPSLVRDLKEHVFLPTLAALAEGGTPFRGLLYAGLMLTPDGPSVVEFNCRFGDPESQVVLPLVEGSLLDAMVTVAEGGSVTRTRLMARAGAALTTVIASGGYPGSYEKGVPIDIPGEIDEDPDVIVFHAGTAWDGDRMVTSGGRVVAVTGLGATLREAAQRSRRAVGAIRLEGGTHRSDIGWRELERA